MSFRELTPDEKVYRSTDLSLVLHKISVDDNLFYEDGEVNDKFTVSLILNEIRRIYGDGYRQRYSDILHMLNSISGKDSDYNDDILSSNLERLVEQLRKNPSDDRYFLALYKLTDHIALEIQRNRDYENLMKETESIGKSADERLKLLKAELEVSRLESKRISGEMRKAQEEIREAHKESQNAKIEIVGILSIFFAIVIAFAGGLDFFGGTISAAGNNIFDVAFAVLLCGLMFFNIIAFLMYMVIAVIRLHDPPKDLEGKTRFEKYVTSNTGGRFVFWFDVVLIVAMGVVICLGS